MRALEQKNWTAMRPVVDYDTLTELTLLNENWLLRSQMRIDFLPQQKLIIESTPRHRACLTLGRAYCSIVALLSCPSFFGDARSDLYSS